VQVYTDQLGRTVREYRPPETVFAEDSLATLGSIPVTEGHPPNGVTPSNHRQVSVGHVSDAPPARKNDGPTEWLETALVISDADTLRKVESGDLVEVSMGYMADVVHEPGVTPSGERYDAVQRNIRFNHLALLKDGHARAGSGARLRLDAAGNQVSVTAEATSGPSVEVNASLGHDGLPYYNISARGLEPGAVRGFLAQTAQNIKDLASWNNVAALKEMR
jgi:uncharacterized protein